MNIQDDGRKWRDEGRNGREAKKKMLEGINKHT